MVCDALACAGYISYLAKTVVITVGVLDSAFDSYQVLKVWQTRLEQVLEGVHFLMESSLPDVPVVALDGLEGCHKTWDRTDLAPSVCVEVSKC